MAVSQNQKSTLFKLKWAEWIFVNLPFVSYMVLLGIIYISNAHASEKALRKIESLKQDLKDTKWRYENLHQQLKFGSIQSQIEDKVKEEGLVSGTTPPVKIIVKENN